MTTLWRLAWALPLVLAIGVGGMLLLRRFLITARPAARESLRLAVRQSLAISEHTSVHVIEIDGRDYLIVESTRQAVVQPVAAPVIEKQHAPARIGSIWTRRRHEAPVR